MSETRKTKVVTPDEVRFSYAHVLQPSRGLNDDADPKYSVSVLVPKKAAKTLKRLKEAIEAAVAEGIEKKWGGKKPTGLKLPIRDGDEERPDDPAYAGMYFFNASSKNKPAVVDKAGDPIIDPMEFYSGCWGHVSVNFYAFNTNGNKGVGAGLGNVLKSRDDESLGGGASKPEDDFADIIGTDSDSEDGGFDFG